MPLIVTASTQLILVIDDEPRFRTSGFPVDIDHSNTESLRLQRVTGLVKNQLQGDTDLDREEGTRFTIRFEKKS